MASTSHTAWRRFDHNRIDIEPERDTWKPGENARIMIQSPWETATALMTVEGEKDDISGVGQTQAAHTICTSLPESRRVHHLQKGVGHYGVFNGSRFRSEIAPRISDFMYTHNSGRGIVRRAVRSLRSA